MRNNGMLITLRATRMLLGILGVVFFFGGCEGASGRLGLAISTTLSHTYAAVGASITIEATVTNRGDGMSDRATLVYYSSSDGVISSTDSQLSTDSVPALAANEVSKQSHSLSFNMSEQRYVGACILLGTRCSTGMPIAIVDDFGSSPSEFGAQTISIGRSPVRIRARINDDSDSDHFRIVMSSAGTLRAYTEDIDDNLALFGALRDSSGTTIRANRSNRSTHDFSTRPIEHIEHSAQSGTYYITVVNIFPSVGDYTLILEYR